MFSNVVYILNNYLVSWFKLHATEVALVRGILQVPIFGFVLLFKKRKRSDEGLFQKEHFLFSFYSEKETGGRISLYQWSMISLYGLLMSSVTLGCLAAIPLMPIGDLIVLAFTSPVFALIFETIILRRPLKVLAVLLCFLIGRKGEKV